MSKSTQRTEQTPNPGSKEALALGCTCPVLDNHYGKGSGWKNPDGSEAFWVTQGCPVHDHGTDPQVVQVA